MRKYQISRRSELPPGFSIDKYEQAKDFTLSDWLVHIEMRVLCAYIISLKKRYLDSEFDPRNATLRIIDNPLYSTHKLEDPSQCSKKSAHHVSVHDMNVQDFFFGGKEYQPEGFDKYLAAFERSQKAPYVFDELLNTPLWKAYEDAGIDDQNDVFIRVDLNATEEKILEEFQLWLRQIRVERGIKAPAKRIGEGDMSDWLRFGLLPYLDLSNWAAANDKVITQQVIGVALFPAEYDINLAERVRKVVGPMARAVANESFTDALRAQLLADAAEQKSEKIIPGKYDCAIATDDGLAIRVPD